MAMAITITAKPATIDRRCPIPTDGPRCGTRTWKGLPATEWVARDSRAPGDEASVFVWKGQVVDAVGPRDLLRRLVRHVAGVHWFGDVIVNADRTFGDGTGDLVGEDMADVISLIDNRGEWASLTTARAKP